MATKFTVEIPDEHVHGITSARNIYNEQATDNPEFVTIDTDKEYVQFVMANAALSYHNQYPE